MFTYILWAAAWFRLGSFQRGGDEIQGKICDVMTCQFELTNCFSGTCQLFQWDFCKMNRRDDKMYSYCDDVVDYIEPFFFDCPTI